MVLLPRIKELAKENNVVLDGLYSWDELKILQNEFDIILKQMEIIGSLKGIDAVSPMTFPFDVIVDYLREDDEIKTISKEEALRNAKDIVEDQIRLPKVVG